MLKRYKPTQPDGSLLTFELPPSYIDGEIILFINGQMLQTQNDSSHPYGYTLDKTNKTFTFYTAPEADDSLYILYDYPINLNFNNVDWTKKIESFNFDTDTISIEWT